MAKKTKHQDNEHGSLSLLEQASGYWFVNFELLKEAVTHASFTAEYPSLAQRNNETLEFLGDAVLDLVISSMLLKSFPDEREGRLTRMRASLVNERHLAMMASSLDLGVHLRLGKGEEASRGRRKSSILACAFESLTGAIFADGGYDAAAAFVKAQFAAFIEQGVEEIGRSGSKNLLQEFLQATHDAGPIYTVEKEEGPAHCRQFTVAVWFQGEKIGTGCAGSKKEAEKQAATAALKLLRPEAVHGLPEESGEEEPS